MTKPWLPEDFKPRLIFDAMEHSEQDEEIISYYLKENDMTKIRSVLVEDKGNTFSVIRKPNYMKKGQNFKWGFENIVTGFALGPNRDYIFSEILLSMKPETETVISSHEGEYYEFVDVIYGQVGITMDLKKAGQASSKYDLGKTFESLAPRLGGKRPLEIEDLNMANIFGFYHKLSNPSKDDINILHLLSVCDPSMAKGNGYGIERENTYKP